jgi:hypothetical protein
MDTDDKSNWMINTKDFGQISYWYVTVKRNPNFTKIRIGFKIDEKLHTLEKIVTWHKI